MCAAACWLGQTGFATLGCIVAASFAVTVGAVWRASHLFLVVTRLSPNTSKQWAIALLLQ